jgi:hypothetical protein
LIPEHLLDAWNSMTKALTEFAPLITFAFACSGYYHQRLHDFVMDHRILDAPMRKWEEKRPGQRCDLDIGLYELLAHLDAYSTVESYPPCTSKRERSFEINFWMSHDAPVGFQKLKRRYRGFVERLLKPWLALLCLIPEDEYTVNVPWDEIDESGEVSDLVFRIKKACTRAGVPGDFSSLIGYLLNPQEPSKREEMPNPQYVPAAFRREVC